MFKKFLRNFFLGLLIFILLTPLIFFIAFQIPPVQRFLNDKITILLQENLNTNVTIGEISYNAPFDLVLTDLFIEDYQVDTLLYMQYFKIRPLFYNFRSKTVTIDKISIKGLKAEYRADSSGFSNFDYLLSNLPVSEPEVQSEETPPINIKINKIDIQKSAAFYSTEENDTIPYQFDLDTLNFVRFSTKITNLNLSGDTVNLRINKFSAYEKSGFKIRHLSTNVTLINEDVNLKNTSFALNKTKIISPIIHFKPSTLGYDDIENIFLELNINKKSTFETADLSYFSPLFASYQPKIKFGLIASGSVANLKIDEGFLSYGSNTVADISGEIIGLPYPDSSYFDIKIRKASTSKNDLLSLKDPETKQQFVEIPDSINIPYSISYTGNFCGMINNFSTDGEIITSSGNANFDFDVILNEESTYVSGLFDVKNFDIGYITKNNDIGLLTMNDTIDLTIVDSSTFIGFNNAKIDLIQLMGYSYSNIDLNVDLIKDTIDLSFSVFDENIDLKAGLQLDLANEMPHISYDVDLNAARLFYLNLIQTPEGKDDDLFAFLSTHFKGYFSGDDLRNLKGKLEFVEPLYVVKDIMPFNLNEFILDIDYEVDAKNDTLRKFTINSDLLDGSLVGEHNISDLKDFASNLMPAYFPALKSDTTKDIFEIRPDAENMIIDFKIKDLSQLLEFSQADIVISDNTFISGNLSTKNRNFSLNIFSDSVNFSGNRLKNLSVSLIGDGKSLSSIITTDTLKISSISLENFMVTSFSENNTSNLNISWINDSELKNEGNFSAIVDVEKDEFQNIVVYSSLPKNFITINDVKWTLWSDTIKYDSSGITIKKFSAIDSSIQTIGALGKISADSNDVLNFYINGFDLSQINPLVNDVKIGGRLRTEAKMSMLMDTFPEIVLFNYIEGFKINDNFIGNIEQNFKLDTLGYIKTATLLTLDRTLRKKVDNEYVSYDTTFNPIIVRADYSTITKEYEVLAKLDNFKLSPFKDYVVEYIDYNAFTKLNGILSINGNTDSTDVQGYVNLTGGFTVVPTGAKYSLNNGLGISIKKDIIIIEETVLTGPGLVGDATLSGTIEHNKFQDPKFDIHLRADTIAFMELERTNSSKYYGTLVASGDVSITGYLENLKIDADIITEPKTNLTLLMDRPDEVSDKTAIVTFINPQDTIVFDYEEDEQENTNIDIDLNLTLKPEAKFKLIFDELTDEFFAIQGAGDIKIKQSAFGDLVLVGEISIEKGEYNFVLENIIKKNFIIEKGSSITFNGDPLDAHLDLTTIYTINNVGLYNLLLDEEYSESKTQADCYINLTGKVLEPDIKFSVKLPKADRKIATQVQNLDEANMNKQFLSLLLISRFQPLPGLTYDPSSYLAGTFNAGELVSNQLNALMSNLGADIDLDLNYITGDAATTDQVDLALSKSFLDGKLNFNTDVGVGGNSVASQGQSNFIGDFEVELKLNQKGNLLLKGFNKTNRNDYYESGYTQGIGILFKTDLDNIFKKDTNGYYQNTTDTLNNN